jgi:hypothetical protein
VTLFQLEPSAKAPWMRTMVGLGCLSMVAGLLVVAVAAVAPVASRTRLALATRARRRRFMTWISC